MTMLWHLYLRRGTVFIPTVARTDAGFYLDVDPVAVLDSTNRQGLIDALKRAISSGNPVVETPTRATFPKPVVLKYAHVKSWAAFEKSASCWTIKKVDDIFELHSPQENRAGSWDQDAARIETFEGEAAIEVLASSIVDQLQGY